MRNRWLLALTVILLPVSFSSSLAELPPLIPREVFFGNPERTNPQISPDGEHLVFAQDTDGDENWHIHTVNIKSGVVRNLTPFKGVQARVVAMDPNFPEQILVATNLRNRRFHEVYRINIKTGEIFLDTRAE